MHETKWNALSPSASEPLVSRSSMPTQDTPCRAHPGSWCPGTATGGCLYLLDHFPLSTQEWPFQLHAQCCAHQEQPLKVRQHQIRPFRRTPTSYFLLLTGWVGLVDFFRLPPSKNEDEIKQNLTFYSVVKKYENAINKILYFSCVPLNIQSNLAFTLQSMTCISQAF